MSEKLKPCPFCGGDEIEEIDEELRTLISKCVLTAEHVGPGGRELEFKVGGYKSLPDYCNACDHKELKEFLIKALKKRK